MVRINLLPPEIAQKRKLESMLGYVVVAAVAVFAVVAIAFIFASLQLGGKEEELATVQQQAADNMAKAEDLKIFETKEQELSTLEATAELALAQRVDWGRLANELSLIVPADMWLENARAHEEDGLSLTGYALDDPDDVPDLGHKAIVKLLVRLADLDLVNNVWLTNSAKQQFSVGDAPATDVIAFTIETSVVRPPAPSAPTTAGVPAPPPAAP